MADPSVRLSASGVNNAGNGGNVTATFAAAATANAGETLIAIIGWNESPAFSTPAIAGWSTIISITTGDFNPLYILGKIAAGGETGATCSFSGGTKDGNSNIVVLCFQNANSSLPTNATSVHDTSGSTTYTIPAITTTKNGSFDLATVGNDGNAGRVAPNFSAWGNSLAELFDVSDSSGFSAVGVAGVTRAAAGVQAATTVTSALNDKNVALRVEVEPATVSTTRPVKMAGDWGGFAGPSGGFAG